MTKKIKGPQDRSRISLLEPHKVHIEPTDLTCQRSGCLSEAIKNVGALCGGRGRELRSG
jgi:hypothetical protein